MGQNESTKPNNPSGGTPPKRGRGKPLFDGTNVLGAALWFASALLTAIVIVLIFIPIDCAGERGQVTGDCFRQTFFTHGGIFVLIAALVVQALISQTIHRLRNPSLVRIGNFLEWIINFIGFFWLVCIQIGAAPGVYAQVITFLRNLTVPTILWWLALIAASIGLDILTHNLFNAPPSGGSAGQQPPRR